VDGKKGSVIVNRSRKGALVGYGFIAERGHVPVYLERKSGPGDFEIVAVADACRQRRMAAASALPGVRVYRTHAEMLAAEAPLLDFVDITTPPYCHAEIAHAALEAGLHVLCEKPIAVSAEEAKGMVEHAARARRVLFPCHNYKFAPVIKAVRRLIQENVIGKVHLVTLQTFRTTHARGTDGWRPNWRRERKYSGGGIAMDHGSHTFYLAFEWLRSHPTAVSASAFSPEGADTEDNFGCTLTFPTGIATAHLTWTAGARKVIYTLHGDRGAITVDDDAIDVLSKDGPAAGHERARRVPSRWMDASHKEWFSGLLDEFRGALDRDDFVSAETIDAVQCMRVISAAYASVRRGSREVQIPEVSFLRSSSDRGRALPRVAGSRSTVFRSAYKSMAPRT
jgi:predicted dehydrogenase